MARRYMDDILLFSTKDVDTQSLLDDCYLPPLKLESAGSGTFLETSFANTSGNRITHWQKNDNEVGKEPKIWRYAHFHSHAAFAQKRAVLSACLKKVHSMASDNGVLFDSAIRKLAEFHRLRYPRKMLWAACTTLGVQTRNPTWFEIRESQPHRY